jgi:uncharacterized membrane protein
MSLLYRLLGLDDPARIERAVEWSAHADRLVPLPLLALLAAAALAVALLNVLPQNVMTWRARAALTLIRLAGFALLAVLLLQLELRLSVERRLRPRVALLEDASGSMDVRDERGGVRRRAAAADLADDLADRLDGRTELSRYAFAWRLEPGGATGVVAGATRLVRALDEAERREGDLDAILLLSDGHDTGGDLGVAEAQLLAARGTRVYPVVFGRPESPPRAEVRLTGGAPYARLGDEFTLSAAVRASGLEAQSVRVALYEDGAAEPVAVKENVPLQGAAGSVNFAVRPTRAGERVYRIVLEGVRGSATERTLAAEHRVDVVDARIRVLHVDIPRDERKLLGSALAREPVVDLATLTLLPKGGWYAQGALRHQDVGDGLPGNEADLYQYDVILLGDIPRAYFRQGGDVSETKLRWLAEFVARRGGGLITLGGRSVYGAGLYQDSALAAVLPFQWAVAGDPQAPGEFGIQPTALGLAHPVMQLERTAEATREAWFDLPTLDGCNRVGAARPGALVLATRSLDGAAMPVIAVQDAGKGKVLALAADTTWRWQMAREAEAPEWYRRFWGNAVRYVAPDPRLQPGRPRIQRSRSRTAVGETVTLSTRLVDPLFQPVRGAELAVRVTSPSGRAVDYYPRDSRGRPGVYDYDVTLDEPGDWTVQAAYRKEKTEQVIRAGESEEEMDEPRAWPERMERLAKATGGRVFGRDEAHELVRALQLRARHKTQSYVVALWNLPVTMALLLALVALDCWLRKRRGMA